MPDSTPTTTPFRRVEMPPPGLPSVGWEYRYAVLPRSTSRAETRRLLSEHAEYGRWELARVLVYIGGARKIWIRRRIQRIQRDLVGAF